MDYAFPCGKVEVHIRREDLDRLSFSSNTMCLDGKPAKGLLQISIIPPKDLQIPFLPLRVKLKSGFKSVAPLCQRCAETESGTPCKHSSKERALTSVWTADEIAFAVCT